MPISVCPLLTSIVELAPRTSDGLFHCLGPSCAWFVQGSESGRCAVQALALGLFGISKKMENNHAQPRPTR